TPLQYADFVRAFGRRRAPADTFVSGWVTVPAGSRIGLGTERQALAMSVLEGPARPDVAGALPFRLAAAGSDRPTMVHVQAPDGREARIPLAALQQGQVAGLAGMAGAHVGIDQLRGGSVKRADAWIDPLARASGVAGLFVLCLGGLGLVVAL